MDWVSVFSLIISTLISGGVLSTLISGVISCVSVGINRKFNAEHEKNMIELKDKLEQKSEDDRRKFEEDRDELKREFEKDLLSIKTNFEKEIYTYKARYDHKVKMMMEVLECVDRIHTAGLYVCDALRKELDCFVEKFNKFDAELNKYKALFCKYSPFVKKEVIENFKRFCHEVSMFICNVQVFWYESKFLIEKDKYANINCERIKRIRVAYEFCVTMRDSRIKFRDIDDIIKQYTELTYKLMDGLSEQVREYLNEK